MPPKKKTEPRKAKGGPRGGKSTIVTLASGNQLERLSVHLPVALAARLRERCAKEHRKMSGAVILAVEAWLAS